MPSIAITGCIGSGKTVTLEHLAAVLPNATTYCADKENRSLLNNDPEVKELIRMNFGKSYFDASDNTDRKQLFNLISSNPTAKTILEEILHPRLEMTWKPLAQKFKGDKHSFFIAEIPLLYEKGLEAFFDRTILVACSNSIRQERLFRNRSLSQEEISAWLKNQLPEEEKIPLADHILWNDSSREILEQQINLLCQLLKTT
jgi:dephospho-CoA kinase